MPTAKCPHIEYIHTYIHTLRSRYGLGIVVMELMYTYTYSYHHSIRADQSSSPSAQDSEERAGRRGVGPPGHGRLKGCNTLKTHTQLNTATHSWSTNTGFLVIIVLCVTMCKSHSHIFILLHSIYPRLTHKQNKE